MLYIPAENRPEPRFSLYALAQEWLKPLTLAVGVVLVVNLFFPRYYVEGKSMDPQLHAHDRLLATNFTTLPETIQRGEIVILTSPNDGAAVVKRVIGLPGETVEIYDGVVHINGVPLPEAYINEPPRYTRSLVLGEDEYYVLGDNRNNSLDSSNYGAIDTSLIRGAVKFRWYPLDQIGVVELPTYPDELAR